jgi:cytochrome c oxidase cbb3-type subunit 1
MLPFYLIRAAGGLLYLAGFLIMVWNIAQTIRGNLRDEKPMTDAAFNPEADRPLPQPALASSRGRQRAGRATTIVAE